MRQVSIVFKFNFLANVHVYFFKGGYILWYFPSLFGEHKLRTTESVEIDGLPIQAVTHNYFIQLRFNKNWKAKSLNLANLVRTKVKII